jgi:hypothetical protein
VTGEHDMSDTKHLRIVEQRTGDEEVEYGPEVPLATRLELEQSHLAAR